MAVKSVPLHEVSIQPPERLEILHNRRYSEIQRLHSVSAHGHRPVNWSMPAGVAQSRYAFVGVQLARGEDGGYP